MQYNTAKVPANNFDFFLSIRF